jgi:hypothetical protein
LGACERRSSCALEATAMFGVRISQQGILQNIDVYKYFTLGKSFLKLDLINCSIFMITSLFIWFYVQQKDVEANYTRNMTLLAPEIFFFVAILLNNIHGHYIVRTWK